mgnify:CR=1 FL=1
MLNLRSYFDHQSQGLSLPHPLPLLLPLHHQFVLLLSSTIDLEFVAKSQK